MNKLRLTLVLMLLSMACEQPVENKQIEQSDFTTKQQEITPEKDILDTATKEQRKKETLPSSDFMSAEWTDLIPEDDLDALLNPPSYIDDIVDGSDEDTLKNKFKNEIESDNNDRYQQALSSTRVKSVVNNAPISIPAFIVPIEFNDEQSVTQFFMVPFFGACLHLPPPPPNQTIFVNYPEGIKLDSLYDAYWISGLIKTSLVENDIATAAYSMDVHHFELYTDE